MRKSYISLEEKYVVCVNTQSTVRNESVRNKIILFWKLENTTCPNHAVKVGETHKKFMIIIKNNGHVIIQKMSFELIIINNVLFFETEYLSCEEITGIK